MEVAPVLLIQPTYDRNEILESNIRSDPQPRKGEKKSSRTVKKSGCLKNTTSFLKFTVLLCLWVQFESADTVSQSRLAVNRDKKLKEIQQKMSQAQSSSH